ncbi:MAG: hypothetical protein FD138_1565 [Planctomycetota bacterium]|nr:MAG: hypothetical protein FD138_1565 [Planctomycetota bacterium]
MTLAFPRLWHGLRRRIAEPLELFAAHGHGRSFGMWSRIGPRELPGIVQCRLWDELAESSSADEPPRALITDIGNDILYGADPQQIAEWVATCLERLRELNARIVLTQLPVASALTLSPSRFLFFRRAFFPGSRLTLEEVLGHAQRLNQLVIELGRKFDVPTPELRGEWYGVDPIHIRIRHRAAAWGELLSPWFDPSPSATFGSVSPNGSLRLWRQRPNERRWFGRVQNKIQPVLHETCGSRLWLY